MTPLQWARDSYYYIITKKKYRLQGSVWLGIPSLPIRAARLKTKTAGLKGLYGRVRFSREYCPFRVNGYARVAHNYK